MNDLTQLSLFQNEPAVTPPPRNVTYIAPTLQAIDRYAHSVCQELAKRTNTALPDTETLRGFAAFIRAAVSTTVNAANRKNNQQQHIPGGLYGSQEIR